MGRAEETVEELRRELDGLKGKLDRFTKFVEGADDLLTEVDSTGCFVHVNETAQTVFGLSPKECVGRMAFDFIHPDDRQPTMEAFGGWIQQRVRSAEFENRQVSVDGEVRHMHWTINPHYDAEGNVVTITSIARDVTRRKEMEEQLRRTCEELEQKVLERTASLAAEKERLAVTLRSIGDGVITTDAAGMVTMINEVAEELTGWPQEEACGRELPEIFHIINEQTRDVCKDPVARVLKTGAIVGLANNTVLVARDGSERIIADSGAPIQDDAGEVIGVVLVFRDSTQKRRAEQRIARQAAVLAAINEILRASIACDTEEDLARRCLELAEQLTESQFGFICEVNDNGRFDTVAISDTGWEACRIPQEKRAEALNDLEIRGIRGRVIQQGRSMVFNAPQSHADWIQPPEGHSPITSFMGVPRKRLGRTVGQIGLANKPSGYTDEDVEAIEAMAAALNEGLNSRRASAELERHRDNLQELVEQRTEKLQAINESLIRSNEELEQFAYVASHDLQEPLRMVSSFSQLLVKQYGGALDETADEYFGYVVEGASRMQALIRDLLAFSRVSTHANTPRTTDCSALMGRVLENLRVSLEESDAAVTCDGLPTVQADASQVVQLLQNLVSNAIKFRGDRSPEVRLEAHEDGAMWHFTVEDNGIGIDARFHARIFIIFQRLHGPRDYAGTGIGLALCKKIVERHGGRIWVESEVDKGAVFHFTLPRDPTR